MRAACVALEVPAAVPLGLSEHALDHAVVEARLVEAGGADARPLAHELSVPAELPAETTIECGILQMALMYLALELGDPPGLGGMPAEPCLPTFLGEAQLRQTLRLDLGGVNPVTGGVMSP